jgi:hypothetical protein
MMKVTIGPEVYLMHFETRKFSPLTGKNTELELEATDCVIRRFVGDSVPVEIARGHVSQTACDQSNAVVARRLAFLKAIKEMPRSVRKPLGDEYNRTCRVVPRTSGDRNRKLRKQISQLNAKISELEKAAKTEKATV